MFWLCLCVSVVVFPFAVFAQGKREPDKELKVTPDKPVEIHSDELVFERERGLTVFKGKVKVTHDRMTMDADEVRATSGNRQATAEGNVKAIDGSMAATLACGHLEYRDKMRYITAHDDPIMSSMDGEGHPVTIKSRQMEFYSAQRMALANQAVEMIHPQGKARADRATFLRDEAKVILEGEPRMFNDQGMFSGRRITATLGNNHLIVEGAVEATFYPTPQPGLGDRDPKTTAPKTQAPQMGGPGPAPGQAPGVSGVPGGPPRPAGTSPPPMIPRPSPVAAPGAQPPPLKSPWGNP